MCVVMYITVIVISYRAIGTYAHRLMTENLPTHCAVILSSYVVMTLFVVSTVAILADIPKAQEALRLWMELNVNICTSMIFFT